ncbi:MAG: RraA family protein [bacterium]|nr:RraA family protein [bacterium]
MKTNQGKQLSYADLLKLKRWNTPTIYNGWEAITKHDRRTHFNLEETRDYMPQMGPTIGYAVTVAIEPGNPVHQQNNPNAYTEYLQYAAAVPGPKIVVVQDLNKPQVFGSFWGEVNSNTHKALGCVGTITDGAIRDVDEMYNAGFKALARRMCIGHAYSTPVTWNCEVEVFGCPVKPGQLIHADKHGFLVIPEEDRERLLDAVLFMDNNECNSVIPAARTAAGTTTKALLQTLAEARTQFRTAVSEKFRAEGEW